MSEHSGPQRGESGVVEADGRREAGDRAVPVLELRAVSKRYGAEPPVYALRDVSFTVWEGELVAIVGRPVRASRRCCT